jgi:hypothetical protein
VRAQPTEPLHLASLSFVNSNLQNAESTGRNGRFGDARKSLSAVPLLVFRVPLQQAAQVWAQPTEALHLAGFIFVDGNLRDACIQGRKQ